MADLGFNVDTGGLDKAQASLDKTTQSAAATEQQANKTSAAISKIGADNAAGSISKTAQSADQLAASLVKASSAAQQHLNVAQALETIVTKTGVSYAAANTALTAAISANAGAATAAGNHANELGKVAQAAAAVTPRLTEAGAAAGGLGRSLGSLGGGGGGPPGGSIGSIAAGLGGLLGPLGAAGAAFIALSVAVSKSSDQLKATEKELQSIYGSTQKGTEALNSIRQSATESGMVFSSLEGYIELARQGLDKMSTSWPVLFGSASQQITKDGDKLREMFVTLKREMDNNSVSIAKENEVLSTLAQSIQTTGGLSATAFQKIATIVPGIATDIARAFHFQNIAEFEKYLQNTGVTAQTLETVFAQLRPKIDASFDINKPKDFEHALEEVKLAWNGVLDTLAATGAFNGINGLLGQVGETVRTTAHEVEILKSLFDSSWNDTGVVQTTNDLISMGKAAAAAAQSIAGAMQAAGAAAASASGGLSVPGGDMGGIQLTPDSSGGGDQSSYGYFATGGSFTVQGSGGTDSQLVSFHATPGEVVTISGGAGSSDMGGTTLAPTGHIDTGGSSGDMAVIDAINNSATAIVNAIHGLGGGMSLSGASNSITSSVTNATSADSMSLQELLFAKLGPFGGGLASGGGGSSGSGGSSSSSGAMDVFSGSFDPAKVSAFLKAANGSNGPGNTDSGNFIYGGTSATPFSNKGAFGVNVPPSLQSGVNFINPADPFHPFNVANQTSNYGMFGPEMGQAGADVKGAVDSTTTAVVDTKGAVGIATEAINTSGDDIVSGAASGFSSVVSSISNMGSELAGAIAAAASASAAAGPNGSGPLGYDSGGASYSGIGASYGGDTGALISGGTSSSPGGWVDLTGGWDGSIGGSSGSGGFDPNQMNYGGGSSSMGYFATGGQFHVAGRGGRDSQPVRFMATPGEVVTITPPGLMAPPSPTGVTRNGRGGHYGGFATGGQFSLGGEYTYMNAPSGSSSGTIARIADGVAKAVARSIPGSYGYEDNQPSKWSGGDGASVPAAPRSEEQKTGSNLGDDRNVTIVVQAGVQAEQFLRSRAQIARAFRG